MWEGVDETLRASLSSGDEAVGVGCCCYDEGVVAVRVRVSARVSVKRLAFGFGDATGSGYRDESRPGIIEMDMQVRAEEAVRAACSVFIATSEM